MFLCLYSSLEVLKVSQKCANVNLTVWSALIRVGKLVLRGPVPRLLPGWEESALY